MESSLSRKSYIPACGPIPLYFDLNSSLSSDSIVVGIMGLTGAGKSTLISTLTEQDVLIGHDLKACISMHQLEQRPVLTKVKARAKLTSTRHSTEDVLSFSSTPQDSTIRFVQTQMC